MTQRMDSRRSTKVNQSNSTKKSAARHLVHMVTEVVDLQDG